MTDSTRLLHLSCRWWAHIARRSMIDGDIIRQEFSNVFFTVMRPKQQNTVCQQGPNWSNVDRCISSVISWFIHVSLLLTHSSAAWLLADSSPKRDLCFCGVSRGRVYREGVRNLCRICSVYNSCLIRSPKSMLFVWSRSDLSHPTTVLQVTSSRISNFLQVFFKFTPECRDNVYHRLTSEPQNALLI